MTETKLHVGEISPDFGLPDLNGTLVQLSQVDTELRLINFWSAECPWVERVDQALAPALAAWASRVRLLSVASNANEAPELLAEVAETRGLRCVLRDADHRVADLYGAVTTPHFYVVDAQGRLRYQGAFDDVSFRQRQPTQAYLVSVVEALLAGSEPAVTVTPTFGCTIVRVGE